MAYTMESLDANYRKARANLLLMLVLTAVNGVLLCVDASISFPFSAAVPQIAIAVGAAMAETAQDTLWLVMGAAVCAVSVGLYLMCYLLSKKRYGLMVTALVLFSVDTLALLGLLVSSFDVSLLIDVAFHGWVLYYLVVGVRDGARRKALPSVMPAEAMPAETAPVDANWAAGAAAYATAAYAVPQPGEIAAPMATATSAESKPSAAENTAWVAPIAADGSATLTMTATQTDEPMGTDAGSAGEPAPPVQ